MTGAAWEHQREVRDALRAIVSDPQLGIGALSSAETMSNLLKDLLPDAPRETSVLVAAAEAGLAQILLDHVRQGMDLATASSLAASALAARTPFTPEACDWAAGELAVALGIAPGEAPRPGAGPAVPGAGGTPPTVQQAPPGDKAETMPPPGAGFGYAQPGYAPPGYTQPPAAGYPPPGSAQPPAAGYPPPGPYGQAAGMGQGDAPPPGHAPPTAPAYGPPAAPGQPRKVPKGWTIATAAIMGLAVIGGIIALVTHKGAITTGTVEPLSRLIQPDVTTCKSASALGMHGISQARSCDTHSAGIGLLGYQFSTPGAYVAGLVRLNILTGFKAPGAGTSCPPPSGRTSGQVGWHSNNNAQFRSRAGQDLECYTYSHDSRILIYLWTLPSERTILVANDGATGATYTDLDTWWAGLSYG